MKTALFLCLVMPTLTFAGTCYRPTRAMYGAPKILCLEKLVESNAGDELLVINGNPEFPPVLTITERSRHNEDRENFTATNVMRDVWDGGCGEGLLSTLTIKGEITRGEINPAYLNVSVEVERTNDTCHSPTRTEVIQYLAE